MKKLLLMLLLALPMVCSAQYRYNQVKDDARYLANNGVLKRDVDGKVMLELGLPYPEGKTAAQATAVVEALLGPNGTLVREPANYTLTRQTDDTFIFQITDELVFSRNFVNSDMTQMAATLIIQIRDKFLNVELKNIIYRTGSVSEQVTGMPHERWKSGYSVSETPVMIVAAEQMISDEVALTRNGELVRSLAKYRVKTIDYIYNLVDALALHLKK